MKRLATLLLGLIITVPTMASQGNENILHTQVEEGYKVGYTIDKSCVLGSDFNMWSIGEGELIKDWYVAYNLETGDYYYITQDAAQEFLQSK